MTRSGRVRIIGAEPAAQRAAGQSDDAQGVPRRPPDRRDDPGRRRAGRAPRARTTTTSSRGRARTTLGSPTRSYPTGPTPPTGEVPAVLRHDQGPETGADDHGRRCRRPSWREEQLDWESNEGSSRRRCSPRKAPRHARRHRHPRAAWRFDLPASSGGGQPGGQTYVPGRRVEEPEVPGTPQGPPAISVPRSIRWTWTSRPIPSPRWAESPWRTGERPMSRWAATLTATTGVGPRTSRARTRGDLRAGVLRRPGRRAVTEGRVDLRLRGGTAGRATRPTGPPGSWTPTRSWPRAALPAPRAGSTASVGGSGGARKAPPGPPGGTSAGRSGCADPAAQSRCRSPGRLAGPRPEPAPPAGPHREIHADGTCPSPSPRAWRSGRRPHRLQARAPSPPLLWLDRSSSWWPPPRASPRFRAGRLPARRRCSAWWPPWRSWWPPTTRGRPALPLVSSCWSPRPRLAPGRGRTGPTP